MRQTKKKKCNFCENQIDHPRGMKAIELGWYTVETFFKISATKSQRIRVMGCPEHAHLLTSSPP